jgi:gamma-glutamylcyclotransferase (GGCT)/AIG2-like uncharacterized protein YtfP
MPDVALNHLRLFVYGTLMPGHGNHRRIERFVLRARPGRITGILVDLGAFPALVPGDGLVEGVLLEIVPSALSITDQIEGYAPNRSDCLYVRKAGHVTLDDETQVTAWTYEFADPQRIRDHPRLPLTSDQRGGRFCVADAVTMLRSHRSLVLDVSAEYPLKNSVK